MIEFPFIGPAYTTRSENYSAQRCVNMYLEQGRGKRPAYLIGTPGSSYRTGASPGRIQAMRKLNDALMAAVYGGQLALYDADINAVATTTGIADDGPADIAFNGTDVLIASGGILYSSTIAVPPATATVVRYGVSSVGFIDGYFVLTEAESGRFYSSGQYTTTIDALDFATAEAAPDNLVRLLISNREVLLMGQDTIEVWYNSGGADFPFSRVQGAVIEQGLAAKDSAVVCGQSVVWLGKGGAVWTLEGYTPKLVSNPAISFAISQWPDPSDARAFFYQQEGHAFYVLSSDSGDQTLVYDLSNGEWHERSYTAGDGEHRILWDCYAFMGGKHWVGGGRDESMTTTAIAELSLDIFLDLDSFPYGGTGHSGQPITRTRSCVAIQHDMKRLRNTSLTVDMDRGVGPTDPLILSAGVYVGSDPVARVRYSKDGGETWSSALDAKLGRAGDFGRRVKWRRVGGGDRTVFEVKISDPVKVCITGAYLGN